MTLVTKQMYHFSVLPKTLGSLDAYRNLAKQQVAANQLQSCLVTDGDKAIYVRLDGSEEASPVVPHGAYPVMDRLRLAQKFSTDHDPELFVHVVLLHEYVRQHAPSSGYMLGDVTKGGKPGTPEELARLEGRQPNGVPVGLRRCATCGM